MQGGTKKEDNRRKQLVKRTLTASKFATAFSRSHPLLSRQSTENLMFRFVLWLTASTRLRWGSGCMTTIFECIGRYVRDVINRCRPEDRALIKPTEQDTGVPIPRSRLYGRHHMGGSRGEDKTTLIKTKEPANRFSIRSRTEHESGREPIHIER